MKRLDLRLTELGLAPTRSKAQQMIRAGEVEALVRGVWQITTDVSLPADQVRVVADAATARYVSRGGLKLEVALQRSGITPEAWRVLDVGLSTGGFTDCLLRAGAAAVLGVDVGRDQLHPTLSSEPRLTSIEGLNARALHEDPRVRSWCADGLDLIVADLSFISLTLVIPALAALAPPATRALLLVKPQFETTAARLNKRGVVEDPAVFADVRARVTEAMVGHGFEILDYFGSEPRGQDGNREFFVSATKARA